MNSNEMVFSVILCTYNRANLLKSALESVVRQDFPRQDYEVIVVDNNSTDDTASVVEEIKCRFPDHEVRYLLEKRQGLSFARNAGARAARARIIAYMDDDAEADPTWLTELLKAFESHPGSHCIGGRVVANWVGNEPAWFVGTIRNVLEHNMGEEDIEIVPPAYFMGCNFAILRKTLFEIGGFSTNLGHTGNCLLSNEELEILCRLHERGLTTYYSAKAKVYHKAFRSKFTRMYAWKRYYRQGISDVVLERNKKVQRRGAYLKRAAKAVIREAWPRAKSAAGELWRERTCSTETFIFIAYYLGYSKENFLLALSPMRPHTVEQLKDE
jgi:glycosyltransferase involved in cell wall biosynthesis